MAKREFKRPQTPYTLVIQVACKVDVNEAHLIENLMRDANGGVLDSLSAKELKVSAVSSKNLLDASSELRRLVEDEVFPGGVSK